MNDITNTNFSYKIVTKEASIINNSFPDGTFALNFHYGKDIKEIDKDNYEVSLSVELKSSEENATPFNLRIVMAILVKLQPHNSFGEEIESFLNINCVQILFPYLRSAVTSLTSLALFPPVILPIIDASKFSPEQK